MKESIYYEVRPVDGLMELYSGVMTNFGGIAWNFVKRDPFPKTLIDWAESEGWVKYEH